MSWVWIPASLIILLFLEGAIWLLYRWIGKRPKFSLKLGTKVYTYSNNESTRTNKKEIDEYLLAFVDLLDSEKLFAKQQLLDIIKKSSIVWKIQPFWDSKEKRYVSGQRSGSSVFVGWNPFLDRTALAHEYMHMFLDEIKGTADKNHKLKPYWTLSDAFSGAKTN